VHKLHLKGTRDGETVLEATVSVKDLLGERVVLAYQGASEEDETFIRSHGGLFSAPPYLAEVRPLLYAGAVVLASGEPIGLGVAFTLEGELISPSLTRKATNTVFAGNMIALGLGGKPNSAQAEAPDTAAQILGNLAQGYLKSWNESDVELAQLFGVVDVRPTASLVFVSSAMEPTFANGDPLYPVAMNWRGLSVDADIRSTAPVGMNTSTGSAAEKDFLLLSGLEGSVLENRIFEDTHQIESISTAKLLGRAADAGDEVVQITGQNVAAELPTLPFGDDVKAEVEDAARRGLTAYIPRHAVTQGAWTGIGYVLLDEETNEAAYQLQGGQSGGVTTVSYLQFPQPLADNVQKQTGATPGSTASKGVARIQKFQSTDFQVGIVEKNLARPLKVYVSDADGYAIATAPVRFRVVGGGGLLADPNLVGPVLPSADITVLSNDQGEASVVLTLGKSTFENATFLSEGKDSTGKDRASTQVGTNLVTVSSELARVSEPFTAFARPDNQVQGNLQKAYLQITEVTEAGLYAQLRVSSRVHVKVADRFGNPISNFGVAVAYQGPPTLTDPPAGHTRFRNEVNSVPGTIMSSDGITACRARIGKTEVFRGDCPAEEFESLVIDSNNLGAYSFLMPGSSPFSGYKFTFGTPDVPSLAGTVTILTTGDLCPSTNLSDCADHDQPRAWLTTSSRGVITNSLGNEIEAYLPGETAKASFSAMAIYEIDETYPRPDGQGGTYLSVRGTNTYERRAVDTATFKVEAKTPGTSLSSGEAAFVADGRYEATMTMAPTPQKNTITWEATGSPDRIKYSPRPGAKLYEVDPADVDAQTNRVKRVADPQHRSKSTGEFSLWGAKAAITEINPSPIFLAEDGSTAHETRIAYTIEPSSYAALLDGHDVALNIIPSGGPEPVEVFGLPPFLTAFGTAGQASGVVTIPAGQPLFQSAYGVNLNLRSVAPLGPGTISNGQSHFGNDLVFAHPRGVTAGTVAMTIDTNNDTVIDEKDDATPNGVFQFWEADQGIGGVDSLVDWATIRFTLSANLHIAPSETLELALPGALIEVMPKRGTGKLYLSDEGTSTAQGDDVDATVVPRLLAHRPGTPQVVLVSGAVLSPGINEFLVKCTSCANAASPRRLTLSRSAPAGLFQVSAKNTDIKPFKELTSAVSVRNALTPSTNAADEYFSVLVSNTINARGPRDLGFAEIPPITDAEGAAITQINVMVHGYNVSASDFLEGTPTKRGSYANWVKRFYWVGHPVLKSQNAWTIGVSWPGDVPGDGFGAQQQTVIYFPESEFNALEAGLPFGRYLLGVRERLLTKPQAKINILAHSLGNMMVNNALKEVYIPAVGDKPGGVYINYVMNDAAIASEAFEQNYSPENAARAESTPGVLSSEAAIIRRMVTHAQSLGFPVAADAGRDAKAPDHTWAAVVTEVRSLIAHCPRKQAEADAGMCESDPDHCEQCAKVWQFYDGADSVTDDVATNLGIGVTDSEKRDFFATRWGIFTPNANDGSTPGAWTRLFVDIAQTAGKDAGIHLYNTFNRGDVLFQMTTVPLVPLNGFNLYTTGAHAWQQLQIYAKPFSGVTDVLASAALAIEPNDQPAPPVPAKWWTLATNGRASRWASTSESVARHLTIWGNLAPSDASPARRTRYWGELASWYPALSFAAGVAPLSSLSAFDPKLPLNFDGMVVQGRNVDFSRIGGTIEDGLEDGLVASHGYLNGRRFSVVWDGFQAIRQLFKQ
jgi:hypothetical protein